MKNLILIALMIFSGQVFAQTSFNGKVTDKETGEALLFANVALYKGTDLVTGAQADFDGFYNLPNLDPGSYNVEVSYVGYSPVCFIKVIIYGGQSNNLDFELGHELEAQVFEYKAPKKKIDNSMHSMNDHMEKLPPHRANKFLENLTQKRGYQLLKKVRRFYRANLMQKLPGRSINSMAQNMLDLGVKRVSLRRVEIQRYNY